MYIRATYNTLQQTGRYIFYRPSKLIRFHVILLHWSLYRYTSICS